MLYAALSLNTYFGFNDELPSWDDLYCISGLRTRVYQEAGEISVHFIDVGQGDCALICTGERNILIDCGEAEAFPRVSRYLRSAGVTRLDAVIMSHPHSDHMGCMYRVLRKFGASEAVMPEIPDIMLPSTGSFVQLMDVIAEKNIPVTYASPGMYIDTGGVGTLEILAPVREYEDLNNFSDVLKYTYGDVSFLFCGDIESDAEHDILAAGVDVTADVIKVPHHGSGTSSTRLFVNAVQPAHAVFCAGAENDYGHPHENILKLYGSSGAEIHRTDTDGDIVFVTDGREIFVYDKRSAA